MITRQRGESITVQVVLPPELGNQVVDGQFSLGDSLFISISEAIRVGNTFTWKISSNQTRNMVGNKYFISSFGFTNLGNRKSKKTDECLIQIVENPNMFSSELTSNMPDLIVNYEVEELELTVSQSILAYYTGRETVVITNKQDGDVITHNLKGRIVARFFDSNYELDQRVYIQYIDDNTVRFKTRVLEDLLNINFNGFLLCEKI